jgi:hypothetical protein
MEELLDAIIALRKLLSDDGRYSICRTDKYPMQLGDAMIVSDATERVDKAIEAAQQQGGQGACPVPHPQMDFEFICDLCGEHIPARR